MVPKAGPANRNLGLSVALLATAVFFVDSTALAQQGGRPATAGRAIDCTNASLQSAINSSVTGDTIRFRGTCIEDIEIRTDALTLDGDADSDGLVDGTIIGSLTVIGVQRVVLRNFDVANVPPAGFARGIVAVDGAVASVDNVGVALEADSAIGVFANRNSLIKLANSTVNMTTTRAGPCESAAASANANSHLVSEGGNAFTNNNDSGVCASNDSYYRQNSGTHDTIEAPLPVAVFDSSLADIRGAAITPGARGGLIVEGNSMLRMRNSDLNGASITLTRLSTCRLEPSTVNIGTISTPLNGNGDASFCPRDTPRPDPLPEPI